MRTVALFGAGQVGATVSRLLGPGYGVCCFADNDETKWGSTFAGIPVLSPEESLINDPDCFCLCVLEAEEAERMAGQLRELGFDGKVFTAQALKMFDARSATMRLLAEQINARNIPGDVAELGVYKGDFAVLINAAFPERRIHLFDTFEGVPECDVTIERREGYSKAQVGDFSGTAKDIVDKRLLYREKAVFHKGYFPHTFAPCRERRFAFVSIDAELYAPTAAALPLFWERLSPGGALMIHDVNNAQCAGVGKAVDEFCEERGLLYMPVCDLYGTAVLRKPL